MGLELKRLDHVNIRTARLDTMIAWYTRFLGMTVGARPDFSFPGAWLYAGPDPIIHLVGRESTPLSDQTDLNLEHFAISATGLRAFLDTLSAGAQRHDLRKVPGFPIVQVNLWDPDGNHIHVDFDAAEAKAEGIQS